MHHVCILFLSALDSVNTSCCATGKGLAPAEHAQLIDLIGGFDADRRERTLLPFLQAHQAEAGRLHAIDANKNMLACLCGTAPASVFMRPAVFEDVQQLIQACMTL